jgi:hypothetical protein
LAIAGQRRRASRERGCNLHPALPRAKCSNARGLPCDVRERIPHSFRIQCTSTHSPTRARDAAGTKLHLATCTCTLAHTRRCSVSTRETRPHTQATQVAPARVSAPSGSHTPHLTLSTAGRCADPHASAHAGAHRHAHSSAPPPMAAPPPTAAAHGKSVGQTVSHVVAPHTPPSPHAGRALVGRR